MVGWGQVATSQSGDLPADFGEKTVSPNSSPSRLTPTQSDFPGAADYGADVTRRLDRLERQVADQTASMERKQGTINLAIYDVTKAVAILRAALAKAGS